MKVTKSLRLPVAAAGVLGLAAGVPAVLAPGVASAQTSGSATYQATLSPVPLNTPAGAASGSLTLVLNGNQAQITEHVQGLGATFMNAPFPHVQHIHGNAMGTCPTASADTSGDGVINSHTEAIKDYGPIVTTLSTSGDTSPAAGTNTKVAPSGASFSYSRTITLDQATLTNLQDGKAVVVVHGLNPSNAPAASLKEKSLLVPSLPLAATAPALCGTLVASQMSTMPSGAPQTGGGSTAGAQNLWLFGLGGGLILGAGGALAARRRYASRV
ncbi:MAG: hypothetical protein ACRDYD_05670 [Acidimicrobiales bacterium]